MENFVFHAPTEIYFGKGQIENLSKILGNYGKNVLLTYGGGSIKKNGLYDKVYEVLKDFNIVELAGVEPNPRIGTVRKGIELCRENNIDVILAVGGGSTIDCSKVVAAGYYYEGDAWDLVKDSSKITKALPLVTVLTLAATGSEMNKGAVISNPETNEKLGTTAKAMAPRASILDPEYTYTLPTIQTAAGTADIMSHVLENYFKVTETAFLQDKISEGILKTCIKYCPIALKEPSNYEARANLMWASSLALNGLCGSGKAGSWTCHPIEHELSAFYDITHGVGLAIVTPRWMRYILSEKTVDKFVDYAVNVWDLEMEEDKFALANKAIDKTERFFAECGIPMNLGKLGIDDSLLEKMSHAVVVHRDLQSAYVPLTEEDVLNILKMCL
ncbi:MAG: iron-containing alcohol dehydrogenase [Clostridia bacterium]|nr:iron-containing alcohol dehydrogenase [Clostridia bacterium]MBQ7882470.1 iron-containing alcohol dehydrogenase [Treponema sp.]